MDNASKALIMAGAILIAVALVGMGVYLVSIISNPADSAVTLIDTNDIMTKNQQIEMYCGKSIKGSEVQTLLKLVSNMNAQKYFPNDITPSGDTVDTIKSDSKFTQTDVKEITASARYDVTPYYDTDGYINKLDIKKTTTT